MAKSDSFFIRAIITSNGSTYAQSEIDLGSFVNLGVSKSTLLRIHNISCQVTDSDSVEDSISGASALKIAHQLTTQSQTALVTANNKSLVCSGSMQTYVGYVAPDGSATADFATQFATHDFDVAPQDFTQGYLVGVDSLFLAVNQNGTFASGNVKVAYVLECTLEPATQANSVALALSQQ
jgi:hypothetical protein